MSSPCSSASSRTITSLNHNGFGDKSPSLFSTTRQRYSLERAPIFYLRITVPSSTAVVLFGPFATPIGVISRLKRYIEGRWRAAQSQLDTQFSSQNGIDTFLHFGMTVMVRDSLTAIDDVLNIEVIREDNQAVKEVIPMQPVWTVVCTEMQHHDFGDPTIRARQVLRSFPPTEAGEREAKALARRTAEANITDGNTPDARMICGVLGVNNIYNIVGTSMGWIVEAILHIGSDIEFETASDENGRRLEGAVLSPVILAQQHMEQQG